MGLFCDSCLHLTPNERLILEPPSIPCSTTRCQLRVHLAIPSLSCSQPVCGASSSFGYRILTKQCLFLLQIGRGSLYCLITHLRAASSPPTTAHCAEIQTEIPE